MLERSSHSLLPSGFSLSISSVAQVGLSPNPSQILISSPLSTRLNWCAMLYSKPAWAWLVGLDVYMVLHILAATKVVRVFVANMNDRLQKYDQGKQKMAHQKCRYRCR